MHARASASSLIQPLKWKLTAVVPVHGASRPMLATDGFPGVHNGPPRLPLTFPSPAPLHGAGSDVRNAKKKPGRRSHALTPKPYGAGTMGLEPATRLGGCVLTCIHAHSSCSMGRDITRIMHSNHSYGWRALALKQQVFSQILRSRWTASSDSNDVPQ